MKMTPQVIVVGGLAVVLSVIAVVVLLPYLIFSPQDSLNARPYTKLEAEGRRLYMANGCMYCHSQFTRPLDTVTDPPSKAGDFNYDAPHQLGTVRTGPDLANISYKRGDKWEIDHLINPRSFTPNSIMPSFSFLSQHQLKALVAYLNRLGNERSAQIDAMVPEKWEDWKNPQVVNAGNWNKGKELFITHCATCHGYAGNGLGPYSHKLYQRPADLRQAKYARYTEGFIMWRISKGVQGTAMPQWENSLSEKERELVALYVRHSFMRPKPHYTDEGELPKEYDVKNPFGTIPVNDKPATLNLINNGKRLYTLNCTPCHGYSGAGRGPDANTEPRLLPEPPDLRDRKRFSTFKDGDWFWRISEGLVFRSMPQWKAVFNEQERWELVSYVRDILALPADGRKPADVPTPKKYEKLTFPKGTSYERGRESYMLRCALCHGYGGQGEGIDGNNLIPPPANFTEGDIKNKEEFVDGRWFFILKEGVGNSAMPIWGLLLSEQERWDIIKYVQDTYTFPKPTSKIDYSVPEEFKELTNPLNGSDPEGLQHSVKKGSDLYQKHCAECHGAKGEGFGEFSKGLGTKPGSLINNPRISSGGDDFIYHTISRGLDHTAMLPFDLILSDSEIWDLVNYVKTLSPPLTKPAASGSSVR
ncbi:MAG: c-type cytochrome [Firmicutes bacterium]|nr:c-type cytochrome [Bacillota bacterium]